MAPVWQTLCSLLLTPLGGGARCTVFELNTENYPDSGFRILNNIVCIKHVYMIGTSNNNLIHPQKEDVYINPKMFKAVIENILDVEAFN